VKRFAVYFAFVVVTCVAVASTSGAEQTPMVDAVYGSLMSFNADGSGDTPVHVNRALHDALHRAG
jgi:hypothetical protein